MRELYLRRAVVSVAPSTGGAVGVPLLAAKNGTRFAGFRTTFEVDKTSESAPNPAKISLYNLSQSSRSNLEDPNLAVFLEAGYAGIGDGDPILSQIYAGDVRRVITRRQGPDVITTIEAGDAEVALRGTTLDQSFAPFTSPEQIIRTLSGKLNLSVGTIAAAAGSFFRHGFSASGLVSDTLDDVTKKLGLEWHVTDGELNVLAPSDSLPGLAILVSKDTGLIGYPSKRIQGIIDFTSFLNPDIKPGVMVKLESVAISGEFRVRTAKYRGDTGGGEFSVAVEAI